MPNYANGKIYKIWSLSTDKIYVGSTVEPLSKRMTKHRSGYKKYQEGKKMGYTTSIKILEYGDAKIELIEEVNCKCKEELLAREGHYIRTLDCVNKQIAGRTNKEWREDNRDKLSQKNKQYLQQYRSDNKEKLAKYHKQHYKKNKEIIHQRHKQYQQNNKEKINLHRSERITCGCGSVIRRDKISRHKKTKKHLAFMNSGN